VRIHGWLTASALSLAVSLPSFAATAATKSVDPETLPKVSCTKLVFSQDFLRKYPKAGAACQEARVYKGLRYAKFSGKVSMTDPAYIVVQVFNAGGDALSSVTFKPQPSSKVLVNGEPTTIADLKVGDPVTFWVSEKRFAMYPTPGATANASKGLPPHT
jgi:hypothetical protein